MPIIRYFVVIGSLLLALLFASDHYLSLPLDAVRSAEVDRTTIRIHSARAVPEKIVFDTSQPVTTPSAVSLAEARPEPREAHAMMATPPRRADKAAAPSVRPVAERTRTQARRVARERWKDRRLALEQGNLFAGW